MAKESHVVGFRVGRETFGVPIARVHEIVRVPEITSTLVVMLSPMPSAPSSFQPQHQIVPSVLRAHV